MRSVTANFWAEPLTIGALPELTRHAAGHVGAPAPGVEVLRVHAVAGGIGVLQLTRGVGHDGFLHHSIRQAYSENSVWIAAVTPKPPVILQAGK